MTQIQSVEIAYLINGQVTSVARLSRRGEWRSGLATFAVVVALSALAAAVVALALLASHRVVYGPAYLTLWVLVGLGAASVVASRAMGRARRYRIGVAMDDDAFAAVPVALVRRTASGYRLRLPGGATGRIDDGRTPLPVESLIDQGQIDVPLHTGSRAELNLGNGTFIVRCFGDAPAPKLSRAMVRRFARRAVLPIELAAVASLLCAVPVGAQIGEADMKSAIPTNATPWEIEKLLRWEAQTQAGALHQCFDVLPISCQRPGYVGIGLSLSRAGEIRSHWIARSTYGADCPVNQCMSDVISGWFFEAMPEPMSVILPVQVLRTDKPLPYGPARAAADTDRVVERRRVAQNGID